MAKVAEGMARVASEIAAGRLARSVLATEIKVATAVAGAMSNCF